MRVPIPILLYHSISEQASSKFARWAVSPGLFKQHMAYLKDGGYQSYTVSELVANLENENFNSLVKPVLVTFDDGFMDFHTHALPVLNRYNMKATIYLTTRYIGATSLWLRQVGEGNRHMMSWEQVRTLRDNGIECGAHGHSHQQLDILPPATAQREIMQSKEILEEQLARPIYSFAYPFGYYNGRVRLMVQKAGFTSASAVKHAMSSTEDDHFALARLIVDSNTDLEAFGSMLEGKNLHIAPYDEKLRTKAWRSMRWLYAQVHSRPWS